MPCENAPQGSGRPIRQARSPAHFKTLPEIGRFSAREGVFGAAVPVEAVIPARGDDTSVLVDPSLRSG